LSDGLIVLQADERKTSKSSPAQTEYYRGIARI
jgi:hypothetical protein